MHRREEGIALKWEDLHIEDDKIVGTPVINLSNGRGEQTCSEAENGFLNAASVGHIVVLEYSMDKDMMLPGQTGPTITKWYNKECSLVDIPGNRNALTLLYDAQENELNLADLNIKSPLIQVMQQGTMKDLCLALNIVTEADEMVVATAVRELVTKADELQMENKVLRNDKYNLQQQIEDINKARTRNEMIALLERALEDRKITSELSGKLASDYATNPEGLRSLLAAMPAYQSIAELLKTKQQDRSEAQWQWDDYDKNDTTGKKLKDLRANDPIRYRELFEKKFAPSNA